MRAQIVTICGNFQQAKLAEICAVANVDKIMDSLKENTLVNGKSNDNVTYSTYYPLHRFENRS
jgi:hypothetical protein